MAIDTSIFGKYVNSFPLIFEQSELELSDLDQNFFTQDFWRNFTPKMPKLQQILRQNSVNCDLLGQANDSRV